MQAFADGGQKLLVQASVKYAAFRCWGESWLGRVVTDGQQVLDERERTAGGNF